jgi:hypothetical protein
MLAFFEHKAADSVRKSELLRCFRSINAALHLVKNSSWALLMKIFIALS